MRQPITTYHILHNHQGNHIQPHSPQKKKGVMSLGRVFMPPLSYANIIQSINHCGMFPSKLNSVSPFFCLVSIMVQVYGSYSQLILLVASCSWVCFTISASVRYAFSQWEVSSLIRWIEISLFQRMVFVSSLCCFRTFWQSLSSKLWIRSVLLGQTSCLICLSMKIFSCSSILFSSTHFKLLLSLLSNSSRSFYMLSLMAAFIFSQCRLSESFFQWYIPRIPYVVSCSLFSFQRRCCRDVCSCSILEISSATSVYLYLIGIGGFASTNYLTFGEKTLIWCCWFSWYSLQNLWSLSSMRTTYMPLFMISIAQEEQQTLDYLTARQVACFGHEAHLFSIFPPFSFSPQLVRKEFILILLGLTMMLFPMGAYLPLGVVVIFWVVVGRSLSGEG